MELSNDWLWKSKTISEILLNLNITMSLIVSNTCSLKLIQLFTERVSYSNRVVGEIAHSLIEMFPTYLTILNVILLRFWRERRKWVIKQPQLFWRGSNSFFIPLSVMLSFEPTYRLNTLRLFLLVKQEAKLIIPMSDIYSQPSIFNVNDFKDVCEEMSVERERRPMLEIAEKLKFKWNSRQVWLCFKPSFK